MKELATILALVLGLASLAHAQMLPNCLIRCSTMLPYGPTAPPPPQPTGDILLVDSSSFLLQTDAVSLVCIAGGC